MGNEMSHGHSHDGQPCHGHGGEDAGHGHSHGAPQPKPAASSGHGHSHNGEPCHGHGGADDGHGHSHSAKSAPSAGHGHSHGGGGHGHSHGGGGHGHSHGGGGGDHGHSHNGQPCHGHGGQPEMDPVLAKKARAVELFMKTMMAPKLPLVFAHFHKDKSSLERAEADAEAGKTVRSGGLAVPLNQGEALTRDEFREVVYSICMATARADRHGVVRPAEVADMERMFLMMIGIRAAADDDSVTVPQPLFCRLIGTITSRIAMQRYDAVPYLLEEWGLPPKCPKLPLLPAEEMRQRIEGYLYEHVVPFLTKFLLAAAEQHKDAEDMVERCGLQAAMQSVIDGLDEADTRFAKSVRMQISAIPLAAIANELKLEDTDKDPHPRLVVFHLVTKVLTMLVGVEPETAGCVFKRWGIDFVVNYFEDAIKTPAAAPAAN